MFQRVFKKALLIDGRGGPPKIRDVGITHNLITAIGERLEDTEELIDCTGLVLAPGFIDMHSHSDLDILRGLSLEHRLRQGITTEVIGQDGFSLAPSLKGSERIVKEAIALIYGPIETPFNWGNYSQYLNTLEGLKKPAHVVTLVGHGTLRATVMGFSSSPPSEKEMERMKHLLIDALESGASGMSVGLIYPPSSYGTLEELVELAHIVAKYRGLFVAHMRDEMDHLLPSVEEMLTIARETGVHIHISHFKSIGPRNKGKASQALELIDRGHREGLTISFDQYPYTATSTALQVCLPQWAQEGGEESFLQRLQDPDLYHRIIEETEEKIEGRGGPESIFLLSIPHTHYKKYEGESLKEVAILMGQEPVKALLLLLKKGGLSISALYKSIYEEDVRRMMKHPAYTVCTDGLTGSLPHPRSYGTFPHILSYYVREEGVLSLEEAIYHMTGRPASLLGLKRRGYIEQNYFADIVIFDEKTIESSATYSDPKELSKGIEYLFIDGELVIERGLLLDVKKGRLIRKE